MKKGKLVTVQIPGQPGRFVKMYEADVKKLQEEQQKKRKPAGDKMRKPGGDKGAGERKAESGEREARSEERPADDLTTIEGIGLATERALKARGIRTFEELRVAKDLSFLSTLAQNAIRRWKAASELDG